MKISSFGFSLVEILVALGVASVAGVILISILVSGNSLFMQQNSNVFQGLSLNHATEQINDSISQASQVANSYPEMSPTYVTSESVLVLKIPSIDSSGNIIDQKFDYIVISQDDQKSNILRKRVFPDPSSSRKNENGVLATTVSSLTFSYLDSNNITVSPPSATKISFSIMLTEKAGSDNKTSSVSGQVNLRNI